MKKSLLVLLSVLLCLPVFAGNPLAGVGIGWAKHLGGDVIVKNTDKNGSFSLLLKEEGHYDIYLIYDDILAAIHKKTKKPKAEYTITLKFTGEGFKVNGQDLPQVIPVTASTDVIDLQIFIASTLVQGVVEYSEH